MSSTWLSLDLPWGGRDVFLITFVSIFFFHQILLQAIINSNLVDVIILGLSAPLEPLWEL